MPPHPPPQTFQDAPPRAFGRALFWPSMAALAPQGLRVRRTAPRFAAATGVRAGAIPGSGTPLRLLGLGDSIIDGVGLDDSAQSMPVRAAAEVAACTGRAVEWQLVGKSGVTSHGALQLLRAAATPPFDHAIVSVGVNDVTALRRTAAWRSSIDALVAELHARSADAVIWFAGLPPLHGFPLLPEPLRTVLGARARAFDAELAARCSTPQVRYVPTPFVPDPSKFAADGYHPNAASHAEWGAQVARAIASNG